MNRTELVAAMAEKTQLSKKDADLALKAFIDVVSEEMQKGEKVQLVGFGTFEVSERAAREGRNPQTGETMTIAASKSPKFKAGKALKDLVNAKEHRKGDAFGISFLLLHRKMRPMKQKCSARMHSSRK